MGVPRATNSHCCVEHNKIKTSLKQPNHLEAPLQHWNVGPLHCDTSRHKNLGPRTPKKKTGTHMITGIWELSELDGIGIANQNWDSLYQLSWSPSPAEFTEGKLDDFPKNGEFQNSQIRGWDGLSQKKWNPKIIKSNWALQWKISSVLTGWYMSSAPECPFIFTPRKPDFEPCLPAQSNRSEWD